MLLCSYGSSYSSHVSTILLLLLLHKIMGGLSNIQYNLKTGIRLS